MVPTSLCPHRAYSSPQMCVRSAACPSGPGSKASRWVSPTPSLGDSQMAALHWGLGGLIHIPALWDPFLRSLQTVGLGGMNPTGFQSYMFWGLGSGLKSWGAWWRVQSLHSSWRNSGFWVPSWLWIAALVYVEIVSQPFLFAQWFSVLFIYLFSHLPSVKESFQ